MDYRYWFEAVKDWAAQDWEGDAGPSYEKLHSLGLVVEEKVCKEL